MSMSNDPATSNPIANGLREALIAGVISFGLFVLFIGLAD
jgi:hypothetical protein